jgi:hypothetical protein
MSVTLLKLWLFRRFGAPKTLPSSRDKGIAEEILKLMALLRRSAAGGMKGGEPKVGFAMRPKLRS